MDTSSSNTVDIIENQILKAINHLKYISKKKPCTLKIFNYLQNNYASNYDYHSAEVKLTILTGKTCALLNSVQKFIEIQGWLLLTFFICLHNQLNSFNSINLQMSEKRDSSNRQ